MKDYMKWHELCSSRPDGIATMRDAGTPTHHAVVLNVAGHQCAIILLQQGFVALYQSSDLQGKTKGT